MPVYAITLFLIYHYYMLMYAIMYLCHLTAQAVTFYLMYLYDVDLLRSLYYVVILL